MTETEWQMRARVSPPARDPDTEMLEEALAEVADMAIKLERSEMLRRQAEAQASRAIARLANVVETVREEADRRRRDGDHSAAQVLGYIAGKLQRMVLP